MTRNLFKSPSPTTLRSDVEELTAREVEVLRLLARGYTNRQIADRLRISPRTAEGHRANLSAKLGFHSRVELVEYAEKHNLLGQNEKA
jgi:two-component system, NarL family, response regulator NreC